MRLQNRDGLDLFAVSHLGFVETAGPDLSLSMRSTMDTAWDAAVLANPALFDGPVVLCTEMDSGASGHLVISWARATYRYRVLRQFQNAPALSSVFVCVLQPTLDGRLVIGRMSNSTSFPGQLQFPGGNMEPPPTGQPLTVDALRHHAAVELSEEIGVQTTREELDLWLVARMPNGNIGFFFIAPSLPDDFLLRRRALLVDTERKCGRKPEFADIALIRDGDDLACIEGHPAEYLGPLVSHFFAAESPLTEPDK